MAVEIDIEHVARLARLRLTDEEKERFGRQLAMILEHAARVGEVAAADVPLHVAPRTEGERLPARRADGEFSHDAALANAPELEDARSAFRGSSRRAEARPRTRLRPAGPRAGGRASREGVLGH
jgi:aspartyl-tRNA(Asn)/glutamyl-tRNA(Gln) amidotransferase subunit C